MSDYVLLSATIKEIDKLQTNHQTFLNEGGAKSYDEYRHVCGIIRGLTLAESIIKDLVQKSEISDD